MTTHVRKHATTITAGADLTGAGSLYKAVAIGGTIAATPVAAVGLLDSKGPSGEPVSVVYEGETKAYAGAAISAGAKLTVTTSGYVITSADSRVSVGRALEAANSGDLFRGLFNFVNA